MATTDNAVKYDVRMLEEILPHLDVPAEEVENMRTLAAKGWLQMDRIVEQAMAIKGSFELVSIFGMDFSDRSDAKSVVSTMRNNNKNRGQWTNSFEIRNIATKVGALRVIAYNKLLDKFHYFYIPRNAYVHLNHTLTITIERFTHWGEGEPAWTGVPKKNTLFWEFECATFEDMCQRG